ncbi:MAG: hypothetical protein NTY47_02895 [Candidatus Omnitrophica bacterium]|nr:hypothetical protein [Candidatus Omnitrophota bacterium]
MQEILNKKSLAKILFAVFLLFLMLYANFYAVRRMEHYAVRAYFYERLSVAYDIGQMPAVRQQLSKIMQESRNPRQKTLAKNFIVQIDTIKEPGTYLGGAVDEQRRGFERVKFLRELAFFLLLILVFIQALMNRRLI